MRQLKLILLLTVVACGCAGCASGPAWKRLSFAFSLPADPPITNSTRIVTALSRVSISPLFQSRSFTYRTGEDSYEQDPYAGFLIPPERALAESIRASLRASGAFGSVLEPGSGITPTFILEISINELYGDFRKPSAPVGTMGLHVIGCEVQDDQPRRVVFDKFCSHETPLARKTPSALMAAWDADLREIINEISSNYAKTSSNNR